MLTLSCLPGIGILGCFSPLPLPLLLLPGIPLLSPTLPVVPSLTSLPGIGLGLSPEALLGPVPPPTPIVLRELRIVRWDPWGPIAWWGEGGESILREYDMQGRLRAEVRERESGEVCEITARKFGPQGEVLLERPLACRVEVIRLVVPASSLPPVPGR